MSNDYHRPTYTTSGEHGPFNATQVRLYGIPGVPEAQKKGVAFDIITGMYKDHSILVAKTRNTGAKSDYKLSMLKKLLNRTDDKKDTSTYVFINSLIERYMLFVGSMDIDPEKKDETPLSAGIIFGYAYEGHTYDLPKPKIMLIPALPEKIPCDDSGYKLKEEAGYAVWIVDKLDKCVEIEVNQGFIEQLVLEANLPGKRSPTMYASRFMMGHRSGG